VLSVIEPIRFALSKSHGLAAFDDRKAMSRCREPFSEIPELVSPSAKARNDEWRGGAQRAGLAVLSLCVGISSLAVFIGRSAAGASQRLPFAFGFMPFAALWAMPLRYVFTLGL
jgi:hypothetical protein